MGCRLASYTVARVQAVSSPTPARDQYHDRMLYWNLRWLSRRRDRGVLTIMSDRMDKAKMAWPQWAFRKPKAFDHCHRPRLVLTGAIAHGWCTDFYLSHDGIVSHGCSMFCEILEQTIARVAAICAREGLEMPAHLCVQSDNTTSQSKNSQACEFLAGDRFQRLTHDARHGGQTPTHPALYDVMRSRSPLGRCDVIPPFFLGPQCSTPHPPLPFHPPTRMCIKRELLKSVSSVGCETEVQHCNVEFPSSGPYARGHRSPLGGCDGKGPPQSQHPDPG